jgi:hypothetical protein
MNSREATVHGKQSARSGGEMKSHAVLVVAVVLSAITCGVTFPFALYRQLALVEVAASMLTAVELYLLSSSIGDWKANQKRLLTAIGLPLAIVWSFLIARAVAKRTEVGFMRTVLRPLPSRAGRDT